VNISQRISVGIWTLLIPISLSATAGLPMLNAIDPIFSSANAVGERSVAGHFDVPGTGAVHALAWSPNGRLLLVTSHQGSFANIYDMTNGQISPAMTISDHGVTTKGAVIYDDGSFIVPVSGVSSTRSAVAVTLKRFNRRGNLIEQIFPSNVDEGYKDLNILGVHAALDSRSLSIIGVDTTAKTRGLPLSKQWPAALISLMPTRVTAISSPFPGDQAPIVRDLALSANGKWAAALDNRGNVRIWSKDRNNFVEDINLCQPRSVTCAKSRISSNGKYVLFSGDETARSPLNGTNVVSGQHGVPQVWSIERRGVIATLHDASRRSATSLELASWKLDDSEIVLTDTGTLSVWTVKDGTTHLSFNREVPRRSDGLVAYPITAVAYSMEGVLAVSAGNHVVIYR